MKRCRVTIMSAVDGEEREFSCEGTLDLSSRTVQLRYAEEKAAVSLILDGETAQVERHGDYSLRLFLKRGEARDGTLVLGGNEGQIRAFTHRVAYSIGQDSLLASLHYDLLFGADRQEMKLRILARYLH